MLTRITIAELRDLIVTRLEQRYSTDHARRMADVVLFGELVGRSSHGILRLLPDSHGPMDETGDEAMETTHTGPNAARIVGRPGMLVAHAAHELLIQLSASGAPAVVAASGSTSTSGSLTYYVERLTAAGLVCIITANTLSVVTPAGGKGPILGTNPVALGVPSDRRPFILDMGTSAITGGEAVAAIAAGRELPPGVAVDPSGNPTNDPGMVFQGGALLPFGGHKGLGISMFVEILSGVLAGSAAAPVTEGDPWGHVMLGIPLAAMGDADRLMANASEIMDRMLALDTTEGAELRIPGQRSLQRRDSALAAGVVDVDAESLESLRQLVEA